MPIPIEDTYIDVLKKAAVGLGLGHRALAARSQLSLKEVRTLLDGTRDESMLCRLAPVLHLDAEKLLSMAREDWHPQPVSVPGLQCFNMPFPAAGYEDASVNCYLLIDHAAGQAVAFDTGTQPEPMLSYLRSKQLGLHALFLTHTHRDHVAAYQAILDATGCALAYAPESEPYANALPVEPGARFRIGALEIEARLTNGHSPGGTTYVVDGLSEKIAMVGDSLFCLSQGGAKGAYRLALENNRRQILSLPGRTVLCPGHGPMTTVDEELAHNPFF